MACGWRVPSRGGAAFQDDCTDSRSDGVRVMIVDDEPLARRGVCVRLRKLPDIEIVGECGDGESAVEGISDYNPTSYSSMCKCPALTASMCYGHCQARAYLL